MKLISLTPLIMILTLLWQKSSNKYVNNRSNCVRIDSIIYNGDKEQIQRFSYNSSEQLISIIMGTDTTRFVYLDKALIRINRGRQHDWDASQYFALDAKGRISRGMTKDKAGDMQVESGFEYDDEGRLAYVFYANYANQTMQQFNYRYPSRDRCQIFLSDDVNQISSVYNIVFDTLSENCLNLNINNIGYDFFPEEYLGLREKFPVHSITQISPSGDTLAHLTYSELSKINEGLWRQNQTDVLNDFVTAIDYFTFFR